MTLKWGILGPGGIAKLFAHDLHAVGLDLVAVGSRSQQNADRFAQEQEVPKSYGSYQALVEDPEIDVIYIATPHSEHAKYAELAMRHGKHVLVEKPFALTGADARRIRDVSRETGRFAMEAMRTRFLPHVVRIHELIDSGALGRVHTVSADHNQLLDSTPTGRLWNPELGGGALLDLGIYPVSFASDFLGRPTEVAAVATMTSTGVDLETTMAFRYADGAHASLQTSMGARGPNRAAIIGEKARIEVASVFYKSSKFQLIDGADKVVEDFHEPYKFWGKQYEAFEVERCIREGIAQSERMTVDESVAIAETLDEVRERIGLHYPGEEREGDERG
jgi:predicted dehydrogenase